jgi:hypothetical protein
MGDTVFEHRVEATAVEIEAADKFGKILGAIGPQALGYCEQFIAMTKPLSTAQEKSNQCPKIVIRRRLSVPSPGIELLLLLEAEVENL